jgi:uncharacterized protein with ParB-like and HNH nuclease domain
MQASDKSLVEIIQGPKQFLIPIFQRTYNWKEIHCALLYKDIISPRQAGHLSKIKTIYGGMCLC